MPMRSHYRRRSAVTWVIWGSAFFGIVAVMAWQFGWIPDADVETGVLVEGPGHEERKRGDESQPAGSDQAMIEPAVFASQSEPALDDRSDFLADGRSTGRRVPERPLFVEEPQTGPARSLPDRPPADAPPRHVAANTPARATGVRQAGFERDELSGDGGSQIVQAGNEVPAEPASGGPPADWLRDLDQQLDAGEYLSVHRGLSKAWWDQPEWRDAIRSRIEKTARAIYFSPQPDYIPPYTVEPGDLLSNIAKKYNVPWQFLERLNRTEARRIRPGQKLKVLKGPFSAVVDLSDRELTVHHYGYFVKRYPAGIGRDGTTPIGKFKVLDKVVNPDYYGTDERTGRRFIVDKDDPANPLGERWIDLGNSYGIHGTIDGDSIGKAESKGCIRLTGPHVEEVYDFLGVGSEVVIQR